MRSVDYACVSHIGLCRAQNQDNFCCDGVFLRPEEAPAGRRLSGRVGLDRARLFAVFDGLGGEQRGEAAAFLAARAAAAWVPGQEPAALCRSASDQIRAYTEEEGLQSVGTTAALAVFEGELVTVCNVGDSKIFRFSGGGMEQLSRDHLAFTPFGGKAPLSQALGLPPADGLLRPHEVRLRCRGGDRFLLCSDGLTDMLENREIARLMENPVPEAAAEALLNAALTRGGRDNITLLICAIPQEKSRLITRLLHT